MTPSELTLLRGTKRDWIALYLAWNSPWVHEIIEGSISEDEALDSDLGDQHFVIDCWPHCHAILDRAKAMRLASIETAANDEGWT
jgi:hypothetical protein